ncbi:glycosyltransferase [Xylophilus sp. Kf1]|nr:glycosyltransferase [Xylophilus sp. Kf1]
MAENHRARITATGGGGMKPLIVAHGHPTLHKGGGEVAAHALHRLLKAEGHASVFVGWGGQSHSPNGGSLTRIGEDDYLLFTDAEHFQFSSTSGHLPEAFAVLLEAYQPDVVHLHHYLHIGIEAAALVKKTRPGTQVVLTLHEYLAICANNGQLFTKTDEVCTGYAPARCTSKCFPDIPPTAFFMREIAIKSALSFVDIFVSPSRFLAEQYIAWGIPAARMSVVENPLLIAPPPISAPPVFGALHDGPLRIGFFGQVNFYKGLDIVVEAVRLAQAGGLNILLGIHGNLSNVTGESYIANLKLRIDALGLAITNRGPYAQSEVADLMAGYHFVVMGSRWFENSPVVMQEAINAGIPLIVPGHGGMAEKARGVGLGYRPGDARHLAEVLGAIRVGTLRKLKTAVMARAASAAAANDRSLQRVLSLYRQGCAG